LAPEVTAKRSTTHGRTAGGIRTKEYRVWENMKERCYNKNHKSYKDYGGRGIIVCSEWVSSFESFLEDMGEAPGKEFTIDRIDNDAGYSKANCRWATKRQQARNRRSSTRVQWEGSTCTVVELSEKIDLPASLIYQRIYSGKPLTDEVRKIVRNRVILIDGEELTITEAAEKLGVDRRIIYKSLNAALNK
jgi:hypothetical protein